MKLLRIQGRIRNVLEVVFGVETVVFRTCWLTDGTPAMIADCPTNPDTLASVRMMGAHYVEVHDDDPRIVRKVETPAPVAIPNDHAHMVQLKERAEEIQAFALKDAALRNGWDAEDLVGTGNGNDPSVSGGCSKLTGLWLVDMALSRPPEGWKDARAEKWPWEILGWTPPGLDFVIPKVPLKVQPPTEESFAEEVAPGIAAIPVMPEEPDDETLDEIGPEYDEEGLDGEDLDEESVEATPKSLAGTYGTKEDLAQALELIRALQEASSKPLSVQKFNYHAHRKHGLPNAPEDVFSALLSLAS